MAFVSFLLLGKGAGSKGEHVRIFEIYFLWISHGVGLLIIVTSIPRIRS
jgi:hypothetical protein